MHEVVPQLQQQPNSHDLYFQHGAPHIIQEQSVSILTKRFPRNGSAEEVQLIGPHVHLTLPQWIISFGEYSRTKFIVKSHKVLVI